MKKCVEQENLSALTAHGGVEGLRLADENKGNSSLVTLDVMMPDVHSKGNRITLSVSENKDFAIITIKDNGIDISSVDFLHILERMYQGDHSRSVRGNDLGLSIVRELVNVHKGKITVANTPDSGTEFTITLPKAL